MREPAIAYWKGTIRPGQDTLESSALKSLDLMMLAKTLNQSSLHVPLQIELHISH